MTERENLSFRNPTVLIPLTLIPTPKKNSNGSRITIEETLIFQFASFTVNYEKKKDTQGIPALSIVFSCALDLGKR
jgi:hypothetical protein